MRKVLTADNGCYLAAELIVDSYGNSKEINILNMSNFDTYSVQLIAVKPTYDANREPIAYEVIKKTSIGVVMSRAKENKILNYKDTKSSDTLYILKYSSGFDSVDQRFCILFSHPDEEGDSAIKMLDTEGWFDLPFQLELENDLREIILDAFSKMRDYEVNNLIDS